MLSESRSPDRTFVPKRPPRPVEPGKLASTFHPNQKGSFSTRGGTASSSIPSRNGATLESPNPTGKKNTGGRKRKVGKIGQKLQPGLPDNWPDSSAEQLAVRPVRHIVLGGPQMYEYGSNFIKTSKYTWSNFIPNFLIMELDWKRRAVNIYFLFIAFLQCIPQISETYGVPTTLIPLAVIFVVDAWFEIATDRDKHQLDAKANSSKVSTYDQQKNKFEKKSWSHIKVGDFVQVLSREAIPADLVVLSVAEKIGSEPTGKFMVETQSLDGETNLKPKQALGCTMKDVSTVLSLADIRGSLTMEHPNKSLPTFQGVIDIEGKSQSPINPNNIALRGCVLRNCDWIIGLVVNTGTDTKILMNMPKTLKDKQSLLEQKARWEIFRIFALLLFICLCGALGSIIWEKDKNPAELWYLNYQTEPVGDFFFYFLHFILIHATFIPVSLYVSIVFVRYFQSYFMKNDMEMYYELEKQKMTVNNMHLNEDLGQISHILSDKTGTLTCNVMDFRKCSINGVSYGAGMSSIGRANYEIMGKEIPPEVLMMEEKAQDAAVKHVAFYCPNYEKDMSIQGPQRLKIQNFFRILSLCHDAEIDDELNDSNSSKILSTSNPDDEALICAADFFGFKFLERRDSNKIFIENRYSRMPTNTEEAEVLHIFPFSSRRKRMAVVIREHTGKIAVYIKGADSSILNFVAVDGCEDMIESTNMDKKRFVNEGLRCLYIASNIISDQRYATWRQEYRTASMDMAHLDRQRRGDANLIDDLEDDICKDAELLGCTAVEDRLQYGVSECCEELLAAGINMWMLTGDSEATAVNIGLASKLIMPPKKGERIIFDRKKFSTKQDMRNHFRDAINKFDYQLHTVGLILMKPWFLIIDGATLAVALEDRGREDSMRSMLIELSQRCRTVIGCRVSPSQKREVSMLIMEQPDVRVLCIGDGANDMPMIRESHVGVGLYGTEGTQAVNAADYAIGQFRYLSPLLLKHGQSNYMRMSNLVCYVFYKNVLMSMAMYWYNFNCGYSGQSYFTEGALQMYNLFYTSLPILYYASYDMMVSKTTFYRFPQTYRACINGKFFTSGIFWNWIFNAIIESIIFSVVPIYVLVGMDQETGNLDTHWEAGMMSMTIIVIAVNLKMLIVQNRFHWSHIICIMFGPLSWVMSAWLISELMWFDFNFYKMMHRVFGSPMFWTGMCLLLSIVIGKDLYVFSVERHFNFQPHHIIQEADAMMMNKVNTNKSKGRVADITPVKDNEVNKQVSNIIESNSDPSVDIESGIIKKLNFSSERINAKELTEGTSSQMSNSPNLNAGTSSPPIRARGSFTYSHTSGTVNSGMGGAEFVPRGSTTTSILAGSETSTTVGDDNGDDEDTDSIYEGVMGSAKVPMHYSTSGKVKRLNLDGREK